MTNEHSGDNTTKTKTYLNGVEAPDRSRQIVGVLSGEVFKQPDVDSGYPVAKLIDESGAEVEDFQRGDGYPDTRSHRLKLGVLVPATNCMVESEMWDIIVRNREVLSGVGIHTTNILTPAPKFGNAEELENYKQVFNANLVEAAETALLAEPQYLIVAFSMEHFYSDLDENASQPQLVEQRTSLSTATWSKAVNAALKKLGARRIGLLCPFDPRGLANATGFFENLGYEVGSAAGLGCASGTDVGHLPDAYKEKVIRERLAQGDIDAIVICGTNLASLDLAENLEQKLEIPIIGINPTLLWYALRENGITAPLLGASRLLREF
jgi:maleate isomerase